ncbi:hypothetical protein C8R44DRAFT_895296 [Mycena epipterygia]|nr:hypothetical protein C8R44DRAFT_895296 [Mycena epipterygia]
MEAPFSWGTKRCVQQTYELTCSVCLQLLVSGHCAHLFPAAVKGQIQVDEAIALGILPKSDTAYDRGNANNGTLQCPTCHLEYFTQGLMAWSPPMDVLKWIDKQLAGKKETIEIRKIFCALGSNDTNEWPQQFQHLMNYYSLIPFFRPNFPNKRYDIYCNLPPVSVVVDGKFCPDIAPLEREDTFRIFKYKSPHERTGASWPALLTFYANQDREANVPVNYWHLPVPCNVILYLFLVEADKPVSTTKFTAPEILLAQKIYKDLKAVREDQETRIAKFATKPVSGLSPSAPPESDDARPNLGCDLRQFQDVPRTRKVLDQVDSGDQEPEYKTHTKLYCSQCWIVVPRARDTQPDFGAPGRMNGPENTVKEPARVVAMGALPCPEEPSNNPSAIDYVGVPAIMGKRDAAVKSGKSFDEGDPFQGKMIRRVSKKNVIKRQVNAADAQSAEDVALESLEFLRDLFSSP